ncbi:hypothetical protein [Pseudactinotalea sp. HY158]|uniref:hypothetical protein n=1 Tax=Pseudactinotalea sp. HY158 TaxID=2654547 RepID=UPI00129CCC66|nr:hypothetical protein [Pseudactinotalea sp. HY158]QGH68688.1 hypothetical protein GCE65_03630 [Pseudactinotalea sp. HY158]
MVVDESVNAEAFTVEVGLARLLLGNFIDVRARDLERQLGFGMAAVEAAPSTYQQLRGAVERSQDTGAALPVSSLFCADSIYLSPVVNQRFRFWHDVSHVQRGLSFELPDEMELALWHLDELVAAGFEPDSMAYRMFEADLVGQLLLMGLIGRFPLRQWDFVLDALRFGLHAALLEEVRRVPATAPGPVSA